MVKTTGEELAGAGQEERAAEVLAELATAADELGMASMYRQNVDAARVRIVAAALREARAEALEEAAAMIDPATSVMARGEVCAALRARATAVRAGKGEANGR